MLRNVRPELLDALASHDPRALHSRGDLRWVNSFMGHADILARTLLGKPRDRPLDTLVDLGAGDGTLLLEVARRIAPRWPKIRAVLVDRHSVVTDHTRKQFEALSWQIESVEADAVQWLRTRAPQVADVTMANLFLHHFEGPDLSALLRAASHQTRLFLACEPRRSRPALAAAGMLGLAGCNGVTVHDAAISVRAGFDHDELSAAWPGGAGWTLSEGNVGRFTHLFLAEHGSGA